MSNLQGVDFYLDWNQGLIVTPSGSIQAATGWDRARQRIIRRIITNAAKILPNGTYTAADNVFSPLYGLGLGAQIDRAFDSDYETTIERLVAQGVLEDEDVDSTIPPSIQFISPNPSTLWIVVGVTLVTGQQGTIAIQASAPGSA
jgi:hypothetical protein